MEDHIVELPAGSYSKEEKLTFNYILLEHIQRCMRLAADDWSGGYDHTKPFVAAGGSFTDTSTTYIRSTAEAYTNAVYALYDLVAAHEDDALQKAAEDIEAKIEELRKEIKEAKNPDEEFAEMMFHKKAVLMRKLFREVLKFLKRTNYLQGTSYSAGLSDDDEEGVKFIGKDA